MIKKSILTAIALFILYSIFVSRFAPRAWHGSQHQWQDNVIKVQNYLYTDSDTIQNVLIGSSLSCRLVSDSFPRTYNLALAGEGIFDGFKALTHKMKLPKNIFIEINYVLRRESKEFSSSLYSPFFFYARKKIPSLREDKQPVAVLGTLMLDGLGKIKSLLNEKQEMKERNFNIDNITVNKELLNKTLKFQIETYSQIPDNEDLVYCFSTLADYISEFEKKGVNIVFYEMPIDNHLENLPYAKIVRETYYENFSTSKYKYISIPDSFEHKTTDGLHLSDDAAMEYTIYLKSELANYQQ